LSEINCGLCADKPPGQQGFGAEERPGQQGLGAEEPLRREYLLPQSLVRIMLVLRTLKERCGYVFMNWTGSPATWKQLKCLSRFGYTPDHCLTKTEAEALITSFGGPMEASVPSRSDAQTEAYELRLEVTRAKEAARFAGPLEVEAARRAVEQALHNRQEFWVDTCREPTQVHSASRHARELYRQFGCLFHAPTLKQAEEILDALDSAMPTWDREHLELFFDTLRLNFPELLRSH